MCRLRNLWQQAWRFCKRLTLPELGLGLGITVFFAYFFYRSVYAIPFMLPVGILWIMWRREKQRQKDNRYHLEQFKECILSVAASLRAGYAVENAFVESIRDMKMMFGEQCRIVEELLLVHKGLRNNETLESLLFAMAAESENEEVAEFAEVFSIAKRNSGNVSDTIALYSTTISEKLETMQEIETLLAAKKLEQRVMNIMPFGIVLYLDFSSPGYFDMLYHNFTGVLLMTVCLFVYLAVFAWSESIFLKAYG